MSYSVLIIGLGKIALGFDLDSAQNNIFSHTKAFLSNDAFELVGGVDVAVERRVEFEEYSGKSSFASVDEDLIFIKTILPKLYAKNENFNTADLISELRLFGVI